MPGKRFRYHHGPHRVRILRTQPGQNEVIVQTRDGIQYSAPMKELRPIAQKPCRRRKKKGAKK